MRCPSCGTAYRVAVEYMNQKVSCTHCSRTFFPKAASARGLRKKNEAAPYLWIGIGVVLLIVVGVVISNATAPRTTQRAEDAPPPRTVNVGWSNERVQEIVKWIEAIAEKRDFDVEVRSDLAALQRQLGIEGTPYDQLVGEARKAMRDKILAALQTHPSAMVFRVFHPQDARLADAAMAEAQQGEVHVVLGEPRDTKNFAPNAEARATVRFRWEETLPKVTGWTIEKVLGKRVPRKPKYAHHAKIKKPEKKKRLFGGKEITVLEAEPVPLDHLPDTPPPLREEIDRLIGQLMDLDASGIVANRAARRLKEIGKPAVPRLLNKFYEVKPKTREDVLALTRVVHALRDLTGVAFGYNPMERGALGGIGATEEERMSALKQWYAWWWKYANRPDWQYAIQKGEGEELFETKAERKARRERERAGGKQKEGGRR